MNISLRRFLILVFTLSLGTLSACGENNVESLCGASTNKALTECDQDDAGDRTAIGSFFASFGIELDDEEIQNASNADIKKLCVDEIGETEITDEDADMFRTALEDVSGCQNTLTLIQIGIRAL